MVSASRLIAWGEGGSLSSVAAPSPVCARAFISPRWSRGCVGRSWYHCITPRLTCCVERPGVRFKPIAWLAFSSSFFWPCLFFFGLLHFSGLVSVCPRRVCAAAWIWNGRCSGHPPTHHPTLHYFDPGHNIETGRGGGGGYADSI